MLQCLTRDQMLACLAEELPVSELAAATDHMESCSACQALAAQLTDDESLRREYRDCLLAAGAAASGATDGPTDRFSAAVALSLDTPTVSCDDTAQADPSLIAVAGRVIGPYRLVERIGVGGFGEVYRAEQQHPIRRTVALKVIKPGMDSREIIARFEAERQALALMDHPNIARILDAGTTGRDEGRGSRVQGQRTLDPRPSALDPSPGRPYFVMELVPGCPITDYCDAHRFSIRKRLDLFITVCQAVQHAHQKGIIHRDLKPSNVLVTERDGAPVVKVIDFGIAKALGASLGDGTAVTAAAQLVGTPLYMSPEQVGLGVLDVDTRSDVYSLGVLLYELLTGTTPFERSRLQSSTLADWQRIVREEEPPRPSARLTGLGETATTIAEHRETSPRELSRNVRGDLDWIVLKALEKERERRYESASELARDVERLLANEPVEACSTSRIYRLRKFAKRNRVLITTAATVAVALLGGTGAATWQAVRASNERARADEKARLAKQVVDKFYTEFAEKWMGGEAGLTDVQREYLEAALAYYEELLKSQPADPAVQFETAQTLSRTGYIYDMLGRLEEAKSALGRAIAMYSRLIRDGEGRPEQRFALSQAYYELGFVQNQLREPEKVRQAYTASLALASSLAQADPGNVRYSQHLAHMKAMLACWLINNKRPQEAEVYLREAVALYEKLLVREPGNVHTQFLLGIALQALGAALRDEKRTEEAEPIYRQALEWKRKTVAARAGASKSGSVKYGQ